MSTSYPAFNLGDPGPSSLNMAPSFSQSGFDMGDEDDDGADENVFRDMTFDEVLEDLNARFLVNLPKEEMTLVRIYWQAEQAHWFYEDYLRPLNPQLPSLGQRNFTQLIIASSPIYSILAGSGGKAIDYDGVWADYISYKSMVPCCGGILINKAGDKCLMVRGWKSNAGWSFPRGKINLNEPEAECAIREVQEETGFDLTGYINEKDFIKSQVSAQMITMFIAPGIDEATVFEAQTRNEIGAIEWVNLVDLPTWTGKKPKKTSGAKAKRFYNVTPFVGPLKRWLAEHGYNPNPSASNKKKPHSTANHGYLGETTPPQSKPLRDLQPYFASSTSPPSSPHRPAARPTIPPQPVSVGKSTAESALDQLFHRFVHKQAEDLASGDQSAAAAGSDQKRGLERLFGGLSVVPPQSALSDVAAGEPVAKEHKDEREAEEDVLAQLLGSIPAPKSASTTALPQSEKASKLLSLLKPSTANPSTTISNTEGSGSGQADLNSSTTSSTLATQDSPSPVPATMKPHQASLLSMLSPVKAAPVPKPAAPSAREANATLLAPLGLATGKPMSLPTSPRPPSDVDEEAERREKQRKLLEMTLAGIGLDPVALPPASQAVLTIAGASGGDGSARGQQGFVETQRPSVDKAVYAQNQVLAQGVSPLFSGAGPSSMPPPYTALPPQIQQPSLHQQHPPTHSHGFSADHGRTGSNNSSPSKQPSRHHTSLPLSSGFGGYSQSQGSGHASGPPAVSGGPFQQPYGAPTRPPLPSGQPGHPGYPGTAGSGPAGFQIRPPFSQMGVPGQPGQNDYPMYAPHQGPQTNLPPAAPPPHAYSNPPVPAQPSYAVSNHAAHAPSFPGDYAAFPLPAPGFAAVHGAPRPMPNQHLLSTLTGGYPRPPPGPPGPGQVQGQGPGQGVHRPPLPLVGHGHSGSGQYYPTLNPSYSNYASNSQGPPFLPHNQQPPALAPPQQQQQQRSPVKSHQAINVHQPVARPPAGGHLLAMLNEGR